MAIRKVSEKESLRHNASSSVSEEVDISGGDHTVTLEGQYKFMVSTSGNIAMRLKNDSADILKYFEAGLEYGYVISIVRQTNTTATGITLFSS